MSACILHFLLMLSMTFAYVVGPVTAVEIRHAHAGDHHHGHADLGVDVGAVHVHHGEHHHPSTPSDDSGEDRGDDTDPAPHSHSHFVTIGADMPMNASGVVDRPVMACRPAEAFVPEGERCPDRLLYELNKPPQLA